MATAAQIADYKAFAAQMETSYEIPSGLLQWLIGKESSWNPDAKNPTPGSTSSGLAGFIDSTAQWRGVKKGDPYSEIQGAASYLDYLQAKTGSWEAALDAYGTTKGYPQKMAEAQAIIQAGQQSSYRTDPNMMLYSQDGNVAIYVPRTDGVIGGSMGGSGKIGGDTSAGGQLPDGSTYGQDSGQNAGLSIFNSDFMGWLKTLLGSAPLIILGIALILIALWSVWSEKK